MFRYYSDNPIADFNRWDEENTDWLNSRPRCYYCEEPIQTDACYVVNGHKYCLDCSEAVAEAVLPQLIEATMT